MVKSAKPCLVVMKGREPMMGREGGPGFSWWKFLHSENLTWLNNPFITVTFKQQLAVFHVTRISCKNKWKQRERSLLLCNPNGILQLVFFCLSGKPKTTETLVLCTVPLSDLETTYTFTKLHAFCRLCSSTFTNCGLEEGFSSASGGGWASGGGLERSEVAEQPSHCDESLKIKDLILDTVE